MQVQNRHGLVIRRVIGNAEYLAYVALQKDNMPDQGCIDTKTGQTGIAALPPGMR